MPSTLGGVERRCPMPAEPTLKLHEAPAVPTNGDSVAPRPGHAADTEGTSPVALLLTSDELAGLLRVSRRCLERWAAAGRVPGRVQLPGRAIRWNRRVVLDWIAAGCPRLGRRR